MVVFLSPGRKQLSNKKMQGQRRAPQKSGVHAGITQRNVRTIQAGESTMTSKTFKFFALFLSVALMVASAASYNVTLFQPSVLAGKELKAGEYKVTLDGDKAIISMGKQKVEAPAKIETADSKYSSTSVRYTTEDGKMKIQEIRLGGTNQKVVFN
jgi:hypothetical protein